MESRVIKFRAWDESLNMMSKSFGFESSVLNFNDKHLKSFDDSMKVMQYVGIKDKNGINICEGDRVRLTYKHSSPKYNDTTEDFTVTYEDDKARFMLFDKTAWWSFDKTNIMEVIGNIYANPELL